MSAKFVVITAVTCTAVCLLYANAICPARENDLPVLLVYQRISSGDLGDQLIVSLNVRWALTTHLVSLEAE